jgi:outer membrane protein assembly factor BamD (BamD/ComL family)
MRRSFATRTRETRVAPRPLMRPALLLAALLLAPALSAQGRVTLLNKDRKAVPQASVVIVSETLESVKFTSRSGGEATRKTADITEIEYGPGSESFEKGLKALADNDLVNAETLFGVAAKDTSPPWVAAHALLRQAQAAAARGKAGLPAALGAIDEFLQRFPDHRLLPQARLEQARYATANGDAATARAALDAVLALVKDGKVTPDWKVRVHLAEGDALLDAGDTKGATRAYAEAETAANANDRLADRPDLVPVMAALGLAARVGTGTCLLEASDLAGARSFYEKLARDGKDDPAVQAAAANGLAECSFRDPAKLKEAQLGFTRVALTATAIPSERARAVYFMGRCAEALAAAGKEPNGRQRAIACFQEVVARYPDTRWARLAQESLP